MARKSVIEKAESMVGKINKRYIPSAGEIAELYDGSDDWFHAVCNGFRYVYMQGMKAAKAEQRRKEAAECRK